MILKIVRTFGKRAGFFTLPFFLFGLLVISPNGTTTIQATPKTFFEGLLISLLCLILLGLLRNRNLKITPHDYLLVIPACFITAYGAFGIANTTASIIHPILIFITAFCGVVLLRNISSRSLENSLLAIALALLMCGISWFIGNDTTTSLGEVVNSTEPWGGAESFRFPLFVINQNGGFGQRNVFSVLLATSLLLLIHFCHTKTVAMARLTSTLPLLLIFATSFFLGQLGSLTASLGLIVGSIFLTIHLLRQRKWQLKSTLLFGALVAGYFAVLLEPTADSLRAIDKISSTNTSTDCRLLWWSFNAQQILSTPLFGSGLDTFSGAFMEYAYTNDGVLDICSPTPSHSHNGLLHLANETGLIGVIMIAGPLLLWLLLTSIGANFFVIAGLLSPIVLHTQTEWPLHVSMIVWALLLAIPVSFANKQNLQRGPSKQIKLVILIGSTLSAAYLISALGAQRGYALERYIIEKSDGGKQIRLLIESKYRLHPAFKPVYDIAISRALIDIAINTRNLNALKLAASELERSIGPMAGHSEIKRILTARKLVAELQPVQE